MKFEKSIIAPHCILMYGLAHINNIISSLFSNELVLEEVCVIEDISEIYFK